MSRRALVLLIGPVSLFATFFLLGYAVRIELDDAAVIFYALALVLVTVLATTVGRRLIRRTAWEPLPGGGWIARSSAAEVVLDWFTIAWAILPIAAWLGATFRDDGWSVRLLPNPLLVALLAIPVWMAVHHRRLTAGALLLTPQGLQLDGLVYRWDTIGAAYRNGATMTVELYRKRLYLSDLGFRVPLAEMHWLIQHYLLFPADRHRMDTLPTREFELQP